MAVDGTTRPPWWRRAWAALAGQDAKAAELPFVGDIPRWRNVGWAEPKFRRLAGEGYSRNGAVFACLSALAMAYPEPPAMVVERDGTQLPEHSLQALLRRPNPIMSGAELDIYKIIYCGIGGSCYLHKIRSQAGRVVELWSYHAGQIRPIPSPTAWVEDYEYVGNGDISDEARRIPASEIVHLKWPSVDPLEPWLPLPPLVAMAREVDTTAEIGRYLHALLVNDAVARTVITIPPGVQLKPLQFEQLRQQFEYRHGGGNRGRVGVVEGGAKIERMALNLEEMAWEALSRVPEARIAAGFRVPAIIAGLLVGLEKATYANYSEARKVFAQDTCVPLWRHHDDELTQGLAVDFGPTLTIRRDLSRVAALQENADAVYTRALQGYEGAIITRNEARLMIGLPRVEDLALPAGSPQLPPGDAFVDSADSSLALPAPIDVTPGGARAVARDLAVKALKADSTRRIERRIERAVKAYLEEQYTRAAEALPEAMDGS